MKLLLAYQAYKSEDFSKKIERLYAYRANNPEDFNKELAAYQQQLETALPNETHKAAFEANFNDFAPFYQCTLLYVCVFVLTCLSWIGVFSKPLNLSALVLTGVTLIVHTGALIARMYMMDRWGVVITNLYGTAIYIGWMSVVLGFIVELIFRNSIGTFVASVAGLHHHDYRAVSGDGRRHDGNDAGGAGHQFLARHPCHGGEHWLRRDDFRRSARRRFVLSGAFTRLARQVGREDARRHPLRRPLLRHAVQLHRHGAGRHLGRSVVGPLLGLGPQGERRLADRRWNALILHARWGGMVKQRGMAVLALMGNILVIWSWWGVNMLGVGLHAYGIVDPSMLTAVKCGVAVHLVLIVVGLTLAVAVDEQ